MKYLGSKRRLLPHIGAAVEVLGVASCADLFAGSTLVGQALKRKGIFVASNDTASYSTVLGRTFIELNAATLDVQDIAHRVTALNVFTPPRDGYFTQTFSREARFFQDHVARKIDGILHAIRRVEDPVLKTIFQASLLLAADKVDSTCGLQMAYLKSWSPRSFKALHLEMPELLPGPGAAFQMDALDAAKYLDNGMDLTFLDPPYCQHRYEGNYHIWETMIRDDNPEAYGVARKRVDVKQTKNRFNSKPKAPQALQEVIEAVRSPYILMTFNDEGFVAREWLEGVLRTKGYTATVAIPHHRYVGSRIGQHNAKGERVGQITHTRNVEHLFICGPDAGKVARAQRAVEELL